MVLHRLLLEDINEWERICEKLNEQNNNLKVPLENNTTTLHQFNMDLSDLFTEVNYYFGKARRNKDAISRIIENVLKDLYKGQNDLARKAAGIQLAQRYPVPDTAKPYYPEDFVNLFELEDQINAYYYALDAALKSLNHKASAKITNNSILNIERSLLPSS
ncbi:hypothetical protein [Virgibacillus salexigens]|uniref:Uncharacterized protein n=1 Tax=Virgibacillus massiliensis TaxID=1462526 RepID=A0A024QI93_9BACI|nr:hypothetical protein [Virgibacillus massiliensis]CDQ41905.1 hypothetical protein BN990_04284 [Virgibacillus massiliensis]